MQDNHNALRAVLIDMLLMVFCLFVAPIVLALVFDDGAGFTRWTEKLIGVGPILTVLILPIVLTGGRSPGMVVSGIGMHRNGTRLSFPWLLLMACIYVPYIFILFIVLNWQQFRYARLNIVLPFSVVLTPHERQ
ncbi:MAG: hypothetical protein EP335_17745 [Alphaproteobacteria bacterium]|nr:MAG: hypothetical protein EP335_17745 [Alphaproteobacteria bacterium]